MLGKSIEHEYNLFELLRRPDVGYEKLTLDGGKYASGDVSRETLGALSGPVVEQVEIAAKYSGYIDRQKGEVGVLRISKNCACRMSWTISRLRHCRLKCGRRCRSTGPRRWAQAAASGVTPAAISAAVGAPEDWGASRAPKTG